MGCSGTATLGGRTKFQRKRLDVLPSINFKFLRRIQGNRKGNFDFFLVYNLC